MSETLEKEVLEAEKNSENTIFETGLFQDVYKGVRDSKGEIREELRGILIDGLKRFVEEQRCNTEPINWEAVEIGFFAGIATVLGGNVVAEIRKEDEKTAFADIEKRIIRKENFIGFNVEFEDSDEKLKIILAKEQYDDLVLSGKTMNEIVNTVLPKDKKVKSICPMTPADLDKCLDISADKILKGETK